jgi:hypothetical protein
MEQEVADARARLAARYGTPTQIGGKGKSTHSHPTSSKGTPDNVF